MHVNIGPTYNYNELFYKHEPLRNYRPGGLHPVSLGDTFKNGRYTVHHKLGFDDLFTLWLARDRAQAAWMGSVENLQRGVLPAQVLRELQNLRHLKEHCRGSLSSNYSIQLFDYFIHKGPHGEHQCLVLELYGPDIRSIISDYDTSNEHLSEAIVFRMSRQLLKAVRFIHNAGMCHNNIDLPNIVFTCYNLSHATKNQLFRIFGFPETRQVRRVDGQPLESALPVQEVKTADWLGWVFEDEEDIRLIDFIDSFQHGEEPKCEAAYRRPPIPGTTMAPEMVFTKRFDYRIDLWRTGCMLYSFLFSAPPYFDVGEDISMILMKTQVEKTTPDRILKDGGKAQWKSMKDTYKERIESFQQKKRRFNPLWWMFAEVVHDPTFDPMVSAIKGLMRRLPSRRITPDKGLELLRNYGEVDLSLYSP